MKMEVVYGVALPFIGTILGSACVFFMKKSISSNVQRILSGFAAGVMIAASVWSLLLPSIEQSAGMGKWSFLPCLTGFWIGIMFLLILDHVIPCIYKFSENADCSKNHLQKTAMMILAVILHNIPEGMAVGAIYAGYISGNANITAIGAFVFSFGISIQNVPEGAIISMPLKAQGMKKSKAFAVGVLSGIVEPIFAVLTIMASEFIVPALPYFLSFAAGAMIYVVVKELIPETTEGVHSNKGTIFFAVGFSIMMILDVALG